MSGVTDQGFEAETVDTLKTAIEDELKNSFGASFNVRPTSVAGIIIGVVAQKLADLWDAAEAIYGSQYPDTATGASLDQLALLTGVQRLPAERSTVVLGITGDAATVIPAGSRVRNADTGTYWRTIEADGDVTIPVAGHITANAESEDYGEIVGAAGTLTTIDTVISGWDSVSNALDADYGREQETDAELRLRRASLLASQGKGTVDAIRADVASVADVESVFTFENTTLITDGDGLPGKSFEVVVLGGDEDEIAQAIWDSKPAGISAYGATTGTAVDTLGDDRIVGFTRPTEKLIYIGVSATTGEGWVPALSADFAQAIVDYAEANLGIGDDVYRKALFAPMFEIEGIVDVDYFYIDFFAAPTATSNLSIGSREIAVFDTSRIGITAI